MNILRGVRAGSQTPKSGEGAKKIVTEIRQIFCFRRKLGSFRSSLNLSLYCLALQLILAGPANAQKYEFIEGFWESACEAASPGLFGAYSKLVLRIEKEGESYQLKAGLFLYEEQGCDASSITQGFQQIGKFKATTSINNPEETHDIQLEEATAGWKPGFRMESILAVNPQDVPTEHRAEYMAIKKAEAMGQAIVESIQQMTRFQIVLQTIPDPRGFSEQVDSIRWKFLGSNPSETRLYRAESLDLKTQRAGQLRKLPKYLRNPKNPQEI